MANPFPRRISISVKDANGDLLRGASVLWFVGDTPVGEGIEIDGHASLEIQDPDVVVSVKATYEGCTQGPVMLAVDQTTYEFRFDVVAHPLWRQFAMKHFAALVGIAFVLLAVVLVFVFKNPT